MEQFKHRLYDIWWTPLGRPALIVAPLFVLLVAWHVNARFINPSEAQRIRNQHRYCERHQKYMNPRIVAYNPHVDHQDLGGDNYFLAPVLSGEERRKLCPNSRQAVWLPKEGTAYNWSNPSYAVTYSCPVCVSVSDEADRKFYRSH